MYLIHLSTVKQINGVYAVDVVIVNKKPKNYSYQVSSEYAVRKFETLFKKGKEVHGRALAVLNKFKITV